MSVTAHAIDVTGCEGDTVSLRVRCSAGFYVRSLAHDLGVALGVGAHLASLRRTASGDLRVDDAVSLEEVMRQPERAMERLVPLGRMLSDVAAVTLTSIGVEHAVHGRNLGPADAEPGAWRADADCVRMLDPEGDLVGIAMAADTPGLLHPSVVLK